MEWWDQALPFSLFGKSSPLDQVQLPFFLLHCPPLKLSKGNLLLLFLKNGRGSSFLFCFDFDATFSAPTNAPIPSSLLMALMYKLKCHNLAKPTNELSHDKVCSWNGCGKNYISKQHCLPSPCCLALPLLSHISTMDIWGLEFVFPEHLKLLLQPHFQ